MVLIDEYDAQDGPSLMRANNSSAFNFRFVAGTGVLSSHSRGMAVDINPLYNPYVRRTAAARSSTLAEAAPMPTGHGISSRSPRTTLLPGVPAPRIHLGRPLEKPEGLPAFREKEIASRNPPHRTESPSTVISGSNDHARRQRLRDMNKDSRLPLRTFDKYHAEFHTFPASPAFCRPLRRERRFPCDGIPPGEKSTT